jgi:N-acetylneuraminic acid mutarotase
VPTGVVEAYDAASNSWTTKARMPTQRSKATARTVNGVLYVIGGYNAATNTDVATVEAYDPATNSWSTKAPMPTARSHAASAAVDGIIYVIGGSAANLTALTTVEAYDPATDTWSTKASLGTCSGRFCPDPRLRGATAEAIDGRIFVLGGSNSTDGYPQWILVYEPDADRWRERFPGGNLQVFRSASSVVLNGMVYVAGGRFGDVIPTGNAYQP